MGSKKPIHMASGTTERRYICKSILAIVGAKGLVLDCKFIRSTMCCAEGITA